MRNYKKTFTILFCLMAYSCGYQLQDTSSLADRAGKVFIETNDSYSPFYKVLKNRMKINGISFSESRSSADTIIIINNDDFKERVITVSSSNYPKEYEINLEVTWSLIHQDQIIIEARDFLRAIETKTNIWPTFQEGMEVNQIIEAAHDSSLKHAWVEVSDY